MPPVARPAAEPTALPVPDTKLLERPPLEVVICEIRAISDTSVTFGSAEGLRLNEIALAAGLVVERIEPTQQQAIRLQTVPGEQPSSHLDTRSVGWRLITTDGSVVTISQEAVNVQTTQYVSWDANFRPLLAGALAAYADVVSPQIRQRVGLRYVDRLVDPKASRASAWRGRVEDSLLGPIADPNLGERVIVSQQQVELSMGKNRQSLMRHGPFSDGALRGAVSYLLDIDVFDTTSTAFKVDDILDVADELNKLALSLFQSALTKTYLAELQGST